VTDYPVAVDICGIVLVKNIQVKGSFKRVSSACRPSSATVQVDIRTGTSKILTICLGYLIHLSAQKDLEGQCRLCAAFI